MKKSSLSNFILMSLLACMFFIACKKDYDLCEGEPETEIKYRATLSNDDMKYFPYKGNETLTFISNKGDTAILVGKGQLFQYPKLRYSGGDDCTNFYDEHAILFTEFVGDNPNFNHLRLEVFNLNQAIILKPYINGRTGVYDYWNTSGIVLPVIFKPELSNIKFNYKDSLINAFKVVMQQNTNDPNYPRVILYQSEGIIGYQPDSSITYKLN
jgi:hypothetical protein